MTELRDPSEILAEAKDRAEGEEEAENEELGPVHSFSLDTTGTHGKRWRGDFVFHVPTIGDRVIIGEVHRGIQSQLTPDEVANGYAHMVAYLTVTIRQAPSWWKDSKNATALHDPTPLVAVYEEVTAYERKFHGGDADDAPDSQQAREGKRSASDSEAVVERDVQSTAERPETIVSHGT